MGVLDSGTINAWEESRGRSRVSLTLLNNQRRHRVNAFLNCKTLALLRPSFSVWLISTFTQCFMDNYYGYHGNSTNFTVSSQKAFGLQTQNKDTRQNHSMIHFFKSSSITDWKLDKTGFGTTKQQEKSWSCESKHMTSNERPMTRVPTCSCSIAQRSWNKRTPTIGWFPLANSNLSG